MAREGGSRRALWRHLAGVAWDTMGAATAVTAEAERNARRLVPLGAETRLFSMPGINDEFKPKSRDRKYEISARLSSSGPGPAMSPLAGYQAIVSH